jgi:hypothetical protein
MAITPDSIDVSLVSVWIMLARPKPERGARYNEIDPSLQINYRFFSKKCAFSVMENRMEAMSPSL